MKKNKILSTVILVSFLVSIIAVSPVSADTVGLVAEWDFDDGIGSVATDLADGNDGELSGGVFGNALHFDGVDDYVNIPDDPSLDITGDLTLEAWIFIEGFSTAEGYHMYVIGKDTSGERSYGIGVDLTWTYPKRPFAIIFHPGGGYKVAWGSSDLVANQWYHLAGVFDASSDQITLYVDGVPQSPVVDTSTVYPGDADLRIGGRQYSGHGCYFNGLIDEVRISDVARYSGAFTPATSPFVKDGNTVGLWHLDESIGSTAFDESDYNNDGTIVGATWAGPTWFEREPGNYALCFDGVDDVVYIANEENFDFDYDDAFTLEAWFMTDSDDCINIISKYDNDPPHAGYQLIKHSSSWGNSLYFFLTNTYAYPGGNQIRCWGTTDVADGLWHYVVVTYDGSGSLDGVTICLDGDPETLSSSADTVTSDTTNDLPLQISGREGTNYVFDGCIDDVKIWNTAFTDVELAFTSNSHSVVPDGSTANLEVLLTDAGIEVEGVTVEFSCVDGLDLGTGLAVTGSDGLASITASGEVGVYTITASAETVAGMVTDTWILAIYDPSAGFVTGGGWIMSPEEAFAADPTLTGKATFGFVSKYKKGAIEPTGNTEFVFHAGDLNFKSTSYQWLVITGGDKAMFKGEGEVNGVGGYGFMLSATDGGKDGVDSFRIKIWDISTETTVYDNKVDSVDETELGGGSIIVHKK